MSYIMQLNGLRYEFDDSDEVLLPTPCPGLYCARTELPGGNWSRCGGCPRGFMKGHKKDELYRCVPCDGDLSLYDWLYLGFMALMPLILHFASIDTKLLKSSRTTIGLVFCAIVEILLAGSITLLLWDPVGSLYIKSCGVKQLSDWYPLFFNPQPNYEKTLHCSHEAVYPLYTIVLVFLALADALMILIRLVASFFKIKVAKSIYSGLYFYPALALGHLVFGGIIYYIFPYITIATSVVSCAHHFASRPNQKFKELILDSVKNWQNVGIILCHWFLHAYGILSITKLENPARDITLLVLVPIPAMLYIFTANFTNPEQISNANH